MDIKKKLEEGIKNILYTAVVLDESSHAELLFNFEKQIPEGWKRYAHHMTITFGKGLDTLNLEDDLGKTVTLTVTELGISDKAIAVKVKGYHTNNKIPHITLAVNTEAGGKPADSNKIKADDWTPVNEFTISGIVTEFFK